MQRATKPEVIQDKLGKLQIGETIKKDELIKKLYGDNDYFIQRSFDVHFSKAKKNIPEMEFKVKSGIITRVK
jgi:hypothetical protein